MIDKAFEFVHSELSEYLRNKSGANVNVDYTNFFGDGTVDILEGRVGFGLINIAEETTSKNLPHVIKEPNGQVKRVNPEVRLNLHVMFAARRQNDVAYTEGLKDISNVISFFQGKRVFTPENSPALPPGLKNLVFDMRTIALEDQSYLWGALTTSYLPSVVYKVRLISINDDVQLGSGPPITDIQQTIA